jgi:hypothetical protein
MSSSYHAVVHDMKIIRVCDVMRSEASDFVHLYLRLHDTNNRVGAWRANTL